MDPTSESEKIEKNLSHQGKVPPIKYLSSHIHKLPELAQQNQVFDEAACFDHVQDVKRSASAIIDQFQEQKKMILHHFDNWILPIAQEVLDDLLQEGSLLQQNLAEKLTRIDQVTADEWGIEASLWTDLYSKWNDRQGVINLILKAVADRTTHLVDRDIQVIQDYQNQSLSHLVEESDTFRSIEERLSHATAEPLKQLRALRITAKEHTSLQQASEWIANLQERREGYFDQLLMKIDHVMKDVVYLEEANDGSAWIEVEGEIVFMERELHHIHTDLAEIFVIEECDKQFLLGRLEGLFEHATDLEQHKLPGSLQVRMRELKSGVASAISRLEVLE